MRWYENNRIKKRDAPFGTGLTELEGSVMMVCWVYLQPSGILLRMPVHYHLFGHPTTSLEVFNLLNDFILSQRRA